MTTACNDAAKRLQVACGERSAGQRTSQQPDTQVRQTEHSVIRQIQQSSSSVEQHQAHTAALSHPMVQLSNDANQQAGCSATDKLSPPAVGNDGLNDFEEKLKVSIVNALYIIYQLYAVC